jgi:uncharacterized protein YecE (DUF72 family)
LTVRELAFNVHNGEQMSHFIGTSGFQYPAWRGTFYPEKFSTAKMLPYYAERLSTTEVNYTFHRIPSRKTVEGWNAATPDNFRFSLKAPQKVTHFAKLRNCADTMQFFATCVAALGNKLGPVLCQLPPTFAKDGPLLTSFLSGLPTELFAAFEFRHPSWFDDEIYESLRVHRAALCLADTSEFSTPRVATAHFGYLRLRREDYDEADVRHWADFVLSQQSEWRDVFVYFKHEESGIGPKLALRMKEMLGQSV